MLGSVKTNHKVQNQKNIINNINRFLGTITTLNLGLTIQSVKK